MALGAGTLEDMVSTVFANVYAGKRVLVTGHTGFKGSWLTAWLLKLGAEVAGFAIGLPSEPCHFSVLGLERRIRDFRGDIRDREGLGRVLDEFKPDIVFHLAAQALVRRSYQDPASTFEINTMGTLNLLECLRQRPDVRTGILITSDKCYRNVEWVWGYREEDRLGGEDPYSGSKGCAEIVFYSYFHSFFRGKPDVPSLATARAGNVIGGGDWAEDRIVPDCVRSWSRGETVMIRSPRATRPWQHVLEPLSGYLWLGSELWRTNPRATGSSYNFGPDASVNQSVETLINALSRYWSGARWLSDVQAAVGQPEATLLKLCCDKALTELNWKATLTFEETVRLTSQWYRQYYGDPGQDIAACTEGQIDEYCDLARQRGIAWSSP